MTTKAAASGRIGLNCALSTPFTASGQIDLVRLVAHGKWVLANGCDGLTVFGTTGEGASIGLNERNQVFGALAASGFAMRSQVIAGASAASLEDLVAQMRAAYDADCRAILLAPPFYFAGVGDDGLFAFFSELFTRLGPQLRDVILYHIPGMTRVDISIELVKRLASAFPGAVIGVKDSNGKWADTERRLTELKGLQILVGDERQLAQAVRMGGAGSICGMANIAPDLLRPLAIEGQDDPRIVAMVDALLAFPFMSAIKAMIADRTGDAGWSVMRAPLAGLAASDAKALATRLAAVRAAKAG
jgi:4-hydroxy-tetrahydrodipicolinate synthase